jgi:hypothetical protein
LGLFTLSIVIIRFIFFEGDSDEKEITVCNVYDIYDAKLLSGSSILIYYKYEVNGIVYNKSIKMQRYRLVKTPPKDKSFLLSYLKTKPDINNPFFLTSDIKSYFGYMPDTLKWVKEYFRD